MSLPGPAADSDSEHQVIQSILFLGVCIRNSVIPDNIEAFCRSCNSKIRYLALKACKGNDELIGKYFRADDPSSSIRQVMVGRSASLSEIVSSFRDSNSGVKVAALKALSRLRIGRADQNIFIMDLLPLINDKEHEVRLLFSKVLRKFSKLTGEVLAKLFDKEDIGTLIYAAEDEYEDVRAESVVSLRYVIKKKVASDGFDFLMDILNDDSLRVRELAMKSMYSICRKYTITKESNGLFGVLVCLREMSPILKKFLLKIVARIRYKDVSIVSHLFSTDLEDGEVLETVRKIVRRNTNVFRDAAKTTLFIFSKNGDRSLYKIEYLVDLVIMQELMRTTDLHISDQVRKDIDSASVLPRRCMVGTVELSKIQGLLTNFLLDVCKTGPEGGGMTEIDDAFRDQVKSVRTITAFGKFIKEYLLNLPLGITNILLIPYKFKFGGRSLRRLIDKYGINLVNEGPVVEIGVLSLVKELVDIFVCSPGHLVLNEYSLSLPETITRQSGLPVEFDVQIDCKVRSRDIFLVLESGGTRISYPARSTVHVLLDDCPSSIACHLACRVPCRQSGPEDGAVMLGITPKTEMNVVDSGHAPF